MVVLRVEVVVTEEIAYRINMKSSYENAGRELLKSKMHRLVDMIVDGSDLKETRVGVGTHRYTMRLGYDRKETMK